MSKQNTLGNLDFLANYFYLSGYTVGKVREVVPSNFSPDDPNQGKLASGLTINRVFRNEEMSEVIVLSTGVVFLRIHSQGGEHDFKGAYPNRESVKEVIEDLIKFQNAM